LVSFQCAQSDRKLLSPPCTRTPRQRLAPSLQAAVPTDRHSVRRLLRNRRPTDAILLQSCSRCWISGFRKGPCSTCARERDRVLWSRAFERKGLRIQVAVQRGQTAAVCPIHVNRAIPGLTVWARLLRHAHKTRSYSFTRFYKHEPQRTTNPAWCEQRQRSPTRRRMTQSKQ